MRRLPLRLRRAGARSLTTDDIDESMLLAVAGVRLDDSPETRSSLLAALGRHPELMASTQMAGSRVISFDVSPDGRTVATEDSANHVRLYAIDTGELLGEFQAGAEEPLSWESQNVHFSPDGRTLAVVMAAPSSAADQATRCLHPRAAAPPTRGLARDALGDA